MEAINYAHGGQNMILTEDAQIVPGVSGNACYLPAGTGTIALQGNRNELSVSLWRQWDGVVESGAVRGIFSFKNIRVFFDNISDLLTVVINGFKAITDIKDDKEQSYWCFTFAKNNRLTVYKNGKEVYSLAAGNKPVETADGFIIGGGRTHATFDEVRVYKTVLKQGEINGLFYLVSKGTQVKQLEKIVQSATPKYLGVTETVPTTRTVVIMKGEKLGAQDAHAGDWVLMAKTVGGWKVGVCYRWTGSMWINLEPEYNYTEQYQAALYHICEIPELMQNTGHFGALFAKVLVAQKALIDKLLVNQALIKNLVVQKLHIDSDPKSHQDFEAWFDETNGLKIKNKEQEIFKVDTAGNVFAKNATLADGVFTGDIKNNIFEISKKTHSRVMAQFPEGEVSRLFDFNGIGYIIPKDREVLFDRKSDNKQCKLIHLYLDVGQRMYTEGPFKMMKKGKFLDVRYSVLETGKESLESYEAVSIYYNDGNSYILRTEKNDIFPYNFSFPYQFGEAFPIENNPCTVKFPSLSSAIPVEPNILFYKKMGHFKVLCIH